MMKKELGTTGLHVTPVGFGVLTVGRNQLGLPLQEGAAVLRYALDHEINFLDTAQYYRTYPYIREALKGVSDDPVIASKSLATGYDSMKEAIEEARRELNRDVIDLFLLHEVRSREDLDRRAGAIDCLQWAKSKGWIRGIGVSTHHVDVAKIIAKRSEMDVLFPLINIDGLGIRQGDSPGSRADMEQAILTAHTAGKGVFGMKVFGGGILLNRYQEAFEYVATLPGIASVMVGFGAVEEVEKMLQMLNGSLDPQYVPDLHKKRMRIDQGDCIACYACMKRCPNAAISVGASGIPQIDTLHCLSCGYCAPVCPVRAIILL